MFDFLRNLFRQEPDLIDLDKYRSQCLVYISQGIPPRPPAPITDWDWTDENMALMRENRRQARLIYDEVRHA